MALPRNKSRPITVDGNRFRYIVSITWKDSGKYDFNITIQNEASNGCKLLLKGLVTRNFWLDFSEMVKEKMEFDEDEYPTITPKHIACFINEGVANGWDHTNSGKNFVLNVNNNDLTNTATGNRKQWP